MSGVCLHVHSPLSFLQFLDPSVWSRARVKCTQLKKLLYSEITTFLLLKFVFRKAKVIINDDVKKLQLAK